MTTREIMLNTMNHKSNPDNVCPYTMGFDDWGLQDQVNKFYGEPWYNKTQSFINHVMNISTTVEVPIKPDYSRDVFGSIWFTGKLPWHLEQPALPEASFKNYKFPTLDNFLEEPERTNAKKHAAENIEKHPDMFHLINMGWGIFEHSWRLRGFEEALCDIALEEDFYAELTDRIADYFVGMVDYCADVKADAFLFGDDWGSQTGVIMGPEKWRKFIKPAWKKVFDHVHKQNKFAICHSCGSIYDIYPDLIEIGLDMHESVQPEAYGMDSFKLKAEFGDKMGFWGTLGSQSIIPYGTPEEIEAHIKKLKEVMNKDGGFILAPAKTLQPGTPVKNAVAIIDTLAAINR